MVYFTLILAVLGFVISDGFLDLNFLGLAQSHFIFPFMLVSFVNYSFNEKIKFEYKIILIYLFIIFLLYLSSGMQNFSLFSNTFGTCFVFFAFINPNFRDQILNLGLKVFIFFCVIYSLMFYIGEWSVDIYGRASVFNHNENQIAEILCLGLFFSFYHFKLEISKKNRLIYIFIMLMLITPILATVSRTGISLLGLFIVIFIFDTFKLKSGVFVFVLLLSIIFLGNLLIGKIAESNKYIELFVERSNEAKDDERVHLWEDGIKAAKSNFLFGVGFNNYSNEHWRRNNGLVFQKIDGNTGLLVTSPASVHNSFIDLILIGGIFLLISYLLILFTYINKSIRLINSKNNLNKIISKLVLLIVISVFLFSFFGQSASSKITWFQLAICSLLFNDVRNSRFSEL
jgi:O-antigen ligase